MGIRSEREGPRHRRTRVGGHLDAGPAEVPRVDAHDRRARLHRQGDLGQRPPLTADGDHRVGRPHHEAVSQLADAGRDRDRDERVGIAAISAREQADRDAARRARAAARRLHHSAQAAAHHDAAGLRDPLSHLLCRVQVGRPRRGHARPADGDVGRHITSDPAGSPRTRGGGRPGRSGPSATPPVSRRTCSRREGSRARTSTRARGRRATG